MAASKTWYRDGVCIFLDFLAHTPISPNAAFILVMGLTGSGKSTFVSRCTGLDVQIGHDLRSCTQSLGIFRFSHGGRDIYLIDTPGFDDTERPDEETLGLVAHFLGVSYANRRYIHGIIYLHRISDNRVSGSNQRNINMLKSLCGEDAYRNVIVASTMWNPTDSQIMFQRERELLSLNSSFGSMCDPDGATYFRHAEMGSGTAEERRSALRIVSHFFRNESMGPVSLLIQHELVDAGQSLEETRAGQALLGEVGKLRRGLQQELNELHYNLNQAFLQQDAKLVHTVEVLRQELQQNSAINDRVHRALMKTLPELHEQEKRRLINRMAKMEENWAKEESNRNQEIVMLQQQLVTSQAKLTATRAKALNDRGPGRSRPETLEDHDPRLDEMQKLQHQVTELQRKHREFSAGHNQKVEAHRNVRRVLADGTISGAVSGIVGAVVAGSLCVVV